VRRRKLSAKGIKIMANSAADTTAFSRILSELNLGVSAGVAGPMRAFGHENFVAHFPDAL